MMMLVVIYGGPRPELIPGMLDDHGVIGWTQLSNAHGAGRSGRREGSRAWPGESQVYFTVLAEDSVATLSTALRDMAGAAIPGERLHVAELPVERFF